MGLNHFTLKHSIWQTVNDPFNLGLCNLYPTKVKKAPNDASCIVIITLCDVQA